MDQALVDEAARHRVHLQWQAKATVCDGWRVMKLRYFKRVSVTSHTVTVTGTVPLAVPNTLFVQWKSRRECGWLLAIRKKAN